MSSAPVCLQRAPKITIKSSVSLSSRIRSHATIGRLLTSRDGHDSAWPPATSSSEGCSRWRHWRRRRLLTGYLPDSELPLPERRPLGSSNDTAPRPLQRLGPGWFRGPPSCLAIKPQPCKGNAITPDGRSWRARCRLASGLLMPALGFNKLQGSLSNGTTAFMMRVSDHGKIYWAKHVFSEKYSTANGIASDGAGGALVVGAFAGGAMFGSSRMTSRSDVGDAFVMHIKDTGAVDWTKQVGPQMAMSGTWYSYARGYAIAPDGDGGALVTGSFLGKLSLGNTTLRSRLSTSENFNSYVFRIARDGAINWAQQVTCVQITAGLCKYAAMLVYNRIASDGLGGAFMVGTGNDPHHSLISIVHVTSSGVEMAAGAVAMINGGISQQHPRRWSRRRYCDRQPEWTCQLLQIMGDDSGRPLPFVLAAQWEPSAFIAQVTHRGVLHGVINLQASQTAATPWRSRLRRMARRPLCW